VLAAYLWFAASGIALTMIDLDTRRLPHAITATAFGVCLALLGTATVFGADGWALVRAVSGAALLWGFYALLRLVRPDGMGGGDVRLALTVGLMLGWLGWGALVVGAFAAFLLGGLFGVALLLRGAGRRTAIPFGPWIVVGAGVGLFAGDGVASSYLALIGVA
jgi:leader peptidase (prepilin peptidase) / N-methyltransferase